MLLSTIEQNKIKRDFSGRFRGSYLFDETTSAPQGQNNYSSNFILEDSSKNKYLLKVLRKNKISPPTIPQIQAEVAVYKRVKSPYVITIIDHRETQNYIYLIFPYLDGGNLADYKREEGRLSEEKIKEIGIGILRGIADIHRNSNGSIVHQDLKPQNILVTSSDEIKLLDFGAARYKQSSFRGSARRNFAYCSREQIRASRPHAIEELRIVIDDRSDVFAAGLVLYFLIEGKHPFEAMEGFLPADAILERKIVPPISRTDISFGLKKIIAKMLEYEALNRLNSEDAIRAFERGDIEAPVLDKSKFFYCSASSIGRFMNFKRQNPKLFDGLVIEACQIPSKKKQIAEMHTNVKTLIIDPQTYLFQKPDAIGGRSKEKFRSFPYYSAGDIVEDIENLASKIEAKDRGIRNFIRKVFQFQIDNGADILLAPYFYLQEFNDDYWTADQEIAKLALEIYSELHTIKPLVKAIAISEEILQSDDSRNRVIEYLQSLDGYAGFFVLLDSSHGETITNESWLKSAKELFTYLLAMQKFVIWSRAELFGLTLAISGLNIATGEFKKQKRFNITEPPQAGGRRGKFFYSPEMFARIKWPEGFRGLVSYAGINQFNCSNNCCSGISFSTFPSRKEEDLAYHSMTAIRKQFDNYTGKEGLRKLARDVEKAERHFEQIKIHPNVIVNRTLKNDIKPGTSAFLVSWRNALDLR